MFYCSSVFTYCIDSVSLAPKFAISVGKFHISKLLENQQTTFAYQIAYKRRNANFWWDTYQQMYMIRANFTFKNFYALPFTKLSLDVSYC